MKYYKVYTMGTKDYANVTSEEVARILQEKGKGSEFIRVRNIFLNPKYITKIVPNDDLNSSYPNGDYGLGKDDPVIANLLDSQKKQLK